MIVCVRACVCVCLSVCVCECLQINHNDITWLGVKADQGLPCVRHYIPRSSDTPLYGPFVVLKHFLPCCVTCRTSAKPVIEV